MARTEKRALNIRAKLDQEILPELGEIRKAIDKTTKRVEKSNKAARRSFKLVAAAVTAVGAAMAALRGIQAFQGLVQATDDIGKLAKATGETTEAVSELQFAFISAGGNAEQFRSVLSSLLSSQRGAIEGSAQQVEAFQKFGLSMKDLRQLKPAQLLQALADGLGNIKDSTEQTLTLTTIFPEQWRNVLNLIRGGGDEFRKQLRVAQEAGATVTKQQAANAAALIDAQQKLATAISLVGRIFLETFGPTLINLIEGLARAIAVNKQAIVSLTKAALSGLQTILKGTLDAAKFIAEVFEESSAQLDIMTEALTFGYVRAAEDTRKEYEQTEKAIRRISRSLKRYQRIQEEVNQGQRESTEEETQKRLATIARREAELARLRARADEIRPVSASIGNAEEAFDKFVMDLTTQAQSGEDVLAGVGKVIGAGVSNGIDVDTLFSGLRVNAQGAGAEVGAEFAAGLVPGMGGALQAAIDGDNAIGKQVEAPFLNVDWESVAAGWKNGLRSVTQQVNNFAETVGGLLANSFTQATSALTSAFTSIIDGTKSAKAAWKDFGLATLRIIAQLIAKMATLKITQAVLGLANGGVLPGVSNENASLPVKNYARGGVARSPQLAVFGEGRQAEAFVPLPDNRSIPVTLNGGYGAGAQQVTLNVYAWDSKDAARGLMEQRETLQSIFTAQADNLVAMRQTIQRAAT